MFALLKHKLRELEDRLNDPGSAGIEDPAVRRRHWLHFHLMDHAFLRLFWTNFARVAEGVYRSNQPAPARLARYRRMGIRSILNLRGDKPLSYYLFEREAAAKLGLTMVDTRLFAKKLPRPEVLIELEQIFRRIEKPFVMHCKSGSDRAGFAAALYLMMIENRPVAEAAQQLHWRFLHLQTTPTGILDHFFRVYAEAEARSGISLMDWIRTEYDPKAVRASFEAWLSARKGRPVQLARPRYERPDEREDEQERAALAAAQATPVAAGAGTQDIAGHHAAAAGEDASPAQVPVAAPAPEAPVPSSAPEAPAPGGEPAKRAGGRA